MCISRVLIPTCVSSVTLPISLLSLLPVTPGSFSNRMAKCSSSLMDTSDATTDWVRMVEKFLVRSAGLTFSTLPLVVSDRVPSTSRLHPSPSMLQRTRDTSTRMYSSQSTCVSACHCAVTVSSHRSVRKHNGRMELNIGLSSALC